jgi:hypothetical protein
VGTHHDLPFLANGNGAPHGENHAGQEPEEAPNAVLSLVVGRDANVHIPHGRISVAESNGWDVTQCRLLYGLQFVSLRLVNYRIEVM